MSQPEERDDDRPWTEAQWEAFMKRADARSAKFGELLETLENHPDRDTIIDHEMGWDRRRAERGEAYDDFLESVSAAGEEAEAAEDDEDAPLGLDDDWDLLDDDDEENDDEEDDDEEDDDEEDDDEQDHYEQVGVDQDDSRAQDETPQDDAADYITRKKDALRNMPVYARSYKYGLTVHRALDDYKIHGQEDQDEDLIDAVVGSMLIAAKLAGGHGMGYDDDALCGNIVCCKRSLAGADQCLRGLRALRDRGVATADVIDPLIQEGEEVRKLVEERIAELRSRVWWE